MWEKGESPMTCTEAYKEHIEYTFNAFCRVVIHYAAINAWRDRDKRRQREISFEYMHGYVVKLDLTGLANNCKAQAEEIICAKLIYN